MIMSNPLIFSCGHRLPGIRHHLAHLLYLQNIHRNWARPTVLQAMESQARQLEEHEAARTAGSHVDADHGALEQKVWASVQREGCPGVTQCVV
jgi:hypothetical protein